MHIFSDNLSRNSCIQDLYFTQSLSIIVHRDKSLEHKPVEVRVMTQINYELNKVSCRELLNFKVLKVHFTTVFIH